MFSSLAYFYVILLFSMLENVPVFVKHIGPSFWTISISSVGALPMVLPSWTLASPHLAVMCPTLSDTSFGDCPHSVDLEIWARHQVSLADLRSAWPGCFPSANCDGGSCDVEIHHSLDRVNRFLFKLFKVSLRILILV